MLIYEKCADNILVSISHLYLQFSFSHLNLDELDILVCLLMYTCHANLNRTYIFSKNTDLCSGLTWILLLFRPIDRCPYYIGSDSISIISWRKPNENVSFVFLLSKAVPSVHLLIILLNLYNQIISWKHKTLNRKLQKDFEQGRSAKSIKFGSKWNFISVMPIYQKTVFWTNWWQMIRVSKFEIFFRCKGNTTNMLCTLL